MTMFQQYVANYLERHQIILAGGAFELEDIEENTRLAEELYWNYVDQNEDSAYTFIMHT